MDMSKLQELVRFMEEHSLSELEFREGDFNARLKRGEAARGPQVELERSAPAAGDSAPPPAAPPENLVEIRSPLVGTFYRSSSPEAESFVEEESRVEPETVVCIIEAMKVMNEIKAELSGTVRKVLVENDQPVEFGQPLFLVEKK